MNRTRTSSRQDGHRAGGAAMTRGAPAALAIAAALAAPPGCSVPPPAADPPAIEFLSSPGAEARGLPFSEAVRVGEMLYLSGQLGIPPGGSDPAPGGIAAETRQALENIKAILANHGSALDRVVKCTVFLADIGEWGSMNEVYRTYFRDPPPARSALGASGLARNARVEIECIAVAGP